MLAVVGRDGDNLRSGREVLAGAVLDARRTASSMIPFVRSGSGVWPLAVLLTVSSGCGGEPAHGFAARSDWLGIERIRPAPDEDRPVLLNQAIEVFFDRPIDPLSLNPDTFQVLDDAGQRVRGDLRIGLNGMHIRFVPQPPLEWDLSDGSFLPGARYRVLLPGFPRLQGIRSLDGEGLDAPRSWAFRTADVTVADGRATPFVPRDVGEAFELLAVRASVPGGEERARVQMEFSLPVYPRSLEAGAIQVWRGAEVLATGRPRILSREGRQSRQFGSVVVLEIEAPVQPRDYLVVQFPDLGTGVGVGGLSDYRGRRLGTRQRPIVDISEQPFAYLDLSFEDPEELESLDRAELAFDWLRQTDATGRVVAEGLGPAYRQFTGDARHGSFAPQSDVVLRVGGQFENAAGQRLRVPDDGRLQFANFHVPEGVTVTMQTGQRDGSALPLAVLATREIRIDGVLQIDSVGAPWTERDMVEFQTGDLQRLLDGSMLQFIAGHSIVVRGELRRTGAEQQGSPATLVSGGRLQVTGRVAARCAFSSRDGSIEGSIGRALPPLKRELPLAAAPAGARLFAEAWTRWFPLGLRTPSQLHVELVGSGSDAFEVAVQTSDPDPLDQTRLPADAALHAPLFPLQDGGSFRGPALGFIRFRIRARSPVSPADTAPTLRRVLVSVQ